MKETKTYRIKGDLVEQIKKKEMEYILDKKEMVGESDVVNAMILKGLETSTNEDISKYLILKIEGKIQ